MNNNVNIQVDGIRSGIQPIDMRHGGFRPGQFVAVSGPNQKMNYSFLFSFGMVAAFIEHKKVDIILTENDSSSLNIDPAFKCQCDYLTITDKSGLREPNDLNLRMIDLDYGSPKFNGWQRYCHILKDNPPDVLILDGSYSLKEFLDVKSLAKDLLLIVKDFNIIVAVNTLWPSLGMRLDPEFPTICKCIHTA